MSLGTVARRRLLGLGLVVVLVGMVGLAVAKYNRAFDGGLPVTLEVGRVGNQLQEHSDVKIRGVIVGEVRKISSSGEAANVELMLRPEHASHIPRNVQARLLPKTLFGEKYVALVMPESPSQQRLTGGDVIGQDRSETARELERVLDGLLPVLQAVKPEKLATTLGSLSQSLQGRGKQLGQTLVQLQTLVSQLNTALPDLKADISKLADFSDNLAVAAPDLVDALDALVTPSKTIADQRDSLLTLYSSVTSVSNDLETFLRDNRDNIIRLAASSRPTLESLARYAPEFPCLLNQLTRQVTLLDKAFGVDTPTPGLHITLEVVVNRGKYKPNQDEPEYLDDRGPRCYSADVVPAPQYPPDGPVRDGSVQPSSSALGALGGILPISDMGLANSPAERQFMATLLAAQSGQSSAAIPNWSTVLVGPLYRGTEVRMV